MHRIQLEHTLHPRGGIYRVGYIERPPSRVYRIKSNLKIEQVIHETNIYIPVTSCVIYFLFFVWSFCNVFFEGRHVLLKFIISIE